MELKEALDEGTVPVTQSAIRHSEKVDKILPAMLAAQKVIAHAKKDAENPHFHSSYASLNAYIDACKEAYNDNDIVVVQGVSGTDNSVSVATMLAHISGQWFECEMTGKPEKPGPQPKGSLITYFRRYTLHSLAFMGAEDDDGNAAQEKAKPKKVDKVKALKLFHAVWQEVVNNIPGGFEADKKRALEHYFLWAKTAKDSDFDPAADYMKPLTGEEIEQLTTILNDSAKRSKLVDWFQTPDVAAAVGLGGDDA